MSKKFLLGSATSAHQVEGNNSNCDYWVIEKLEHTFFEEPSGDAVDHYHRYEEDIQLLKKAGLNAYRFSIEWARIEPEKGKYSAEEIEHYRKVLQCCIDNGITPVVTMLHFTSPKWLITEGGWVAESIVEYFKNYCVYVAEQLGDLMEYVCTINEANLPLMITKIVEMIALAATIQVGLNEQARQKNDPLAEEESIAFGVESARSFLNGSSKEEEKIIFRAHEAARDGMKAVCPHFKVGITLSVKDVQVLEGGEEKAAELWDNDFLHYLPYIQNDDFLGVQTYTRVVIGPDGEVPVAEDAVKTQGGNEYYPESLGHVVRKVSESFHKPIMITENGIDTSDDQQRIAFIKTATEGLKQCMADGINVIGYLHWSLLDNFEWSAGYRMTYGLIAVDRTTQERKPKESLYQLSTIWNS